MVQKYNINAINASIVKISGGSNTWQNDSKQLGHKGNGRSRRHEGQLRAHFLVTENSLFN